jgi:hypothetical protein
VIAMKSLKVNDLKIFTKMSKSSEALIRISDKANIRINHHFFNKFFGPDNILSAQYLRLGYSEDRGMMFFMFHADKRPGSIRVPGNAMEKGMIFYRRPFFMQNKLDLSKVGRKSYTPEMITLEVDSDKFDGVFVIALR